MNTQIRNYSQVPAGSPNPVRAAREAAGMTYPQMLAAAVVADKTLANTEHGIAPTIPAAIETVLADHGVDLEQLRTDYARWRAEQRVNARPVLDRIVPHSLYTNEAVEALVREAGHPGPVFKKLYVEAGFSGQRVVNALKVQDTVFRRWAAGTTKSTPAELATAFEQSGWQRWRLFDF